MDIVSSSNVFVSDCYIEGGDDCICLKARLKNKPCENVTVSNCVLISDDSAIKLGTRSTGDIKQCVFNNIVIRDSRYGISMFMKDGGIYEDIHFSDISIETDTLYARHRNVYPIIMDLEKRTETSKVGRIRNVVFSNVSITTRGNCLIGGMPERSIEDITFDTVRMRVVSPTGLSKLRKPRGVRNLPTPKPGTDYASQPAHFTFANMKGLSLRNISITVEDQDPSNERHAVWGFNLEDVTVDGYKGRQAVPNKKSAAFYFQQCRNLFIRGSQAVPGSGTFLHLEGENTDRVSVIGNDLSGAERAFEIAKHVNKNAFYQSFNRLK